jgi:hypothetical protein
MQQIPLTQGYVALVSDEDFEALSRYRWCAMRVRGGRVYAVRHAPADNKRLLYMHEVVAGTPAGMLTHHIGETLDNQRHMLATVTRSQHQAIHWQERPRRVRRMAQTALPTPPAWYNLPAAAAQLGLTRQRVYQIATRRNIGAYIPGDHGGAWRFTDADLGLIQLLRGTRVRFGEPQTALKQEA